MSFIVTILAAIYPLVDNYLEVILIVLYTFLQFSTIDYDREAYYFGKERKNIHSTYLDITLATVSFIYAAAIVQTVVVKVFDKEPFFTNILIFNSDKSLFLVMLIRILLISFVFVIGYILFVYTYAIDRKGTRDNQSKVAALKRIEKNLSKKRILIVIILGVMVSFFHFAEVDSSEIGAENMVLFQNYLTVFHLFATAFIIPLLINELNLSGRINVEQPSRRTQMKRKLPRRVKAVRVSKIETR